MARIEAGAAPGRRTPAQAGLELVVVLAVTTALLSLFPASHATDASRLDRVMAPAKILLAVLLATWLQRRAGGGWRELGLRRPSRLWRVPVVAIAGYLGGELCGQLTAQFLLPLMGLHAPGAPAFLARLPGNVADYLYWMIPVTWGSAAFGEEMLFRGFVLDRLNQLLGGRAIWAAAVLQALLFGAAHAYLGAGGAVIAGVLGLVLGVVFVAGGRNLWPCILIHGLIDSTSITAVFLGLAHR